MIDVGGAALLGAAARNSAGVAAASPTRRTTRDRRGAARARPWSARRRGRGSPPRRSARSPPTTPRSPPTSTRSPATRSRAGWRSCSRRSTTCATARTRTSARRSTARRRTAAGRSPTRPSSRATGRRSTTCSTSTRPTGSRATTRRRPWPSSSTPTRSGWPRTTSSSRPTATPSRRIRWRRSAGSSAVNRELDGATAREIAANSYEAVVAPGFSQAAIGILRGKAGLELLAVPPDPTEGMRDYGIANLDFKRVAGGLLVETLDELGLDRGQLQVVTTAPTDAGGADRPAVRLARRPPRPLERDRPRPQRGDGRDRRRPGVAARCRSRSRSAAPATGEDRGHGVGRVLPVPRRHPGRGQAGVTAIIQPGGSIRDEMAIEVADRHHMAMVFTGRRHFRPTRYRTRRRNSCSRSRWSA